jgi:tRNA1(Val) A37 N6-methylase TrmN6
MAKSPLGPAGIAIGDKTEALSDESLSADTLLGGKLRLRQPVLGYRAAIDPVLLAAAVPARPSDLVCDAGAGVGAGLLCLAARVPECRIVGLERDGLMAQLARDNAADNGFSDRVEIMTGDIVDPPSNLPRGAFDHVMMNPPYLEPSRARAPAHKARAAAMVEDGAGLSDWIRFAHGALRDRGMLTIIHRADCLDRLMAALASRFAGVVVFPLWPAEGRAAKRLIVRARKNTKEPASLLPGLVLHGAGGGFTSAAESVLRQGRGLDF